MDIKWLEDLIALGQTGSLSRAAALRHVTQPAFGRRIRAFEDWAGIDIFRFDADGKIVEHWDVLQVVPAESRHENGMFCLAPIVGL